jgi:hypothetical protein
MITDELIQQLKTYITEHYKLVSIPSHSSSLGKASPMFNTGDFGKIADMMKLFVRNERNQETFSTLLETFRVEKNLTTVELYTGAWIDKRLYSKIKAERKYKPSKNTVLSFGIALKLDKSEMDTLLESAGFSLSRSSMTDLVVLFCIEHSIYDLHDINALLYQAGQKPLSQE